AGMDNPNAVPKKRFITVQTLIISPTYQTDRDNNTRSIEAEIFYTPTIPCLAAGIRQPLFGLTSVQLRWRPYVGFELRDYLRRATAASSMFHHHDIARFTIRAELELALGNWFALTGSCVSRTDLGDAHDSFNYGQLSGQLFLDPVLPTNGDPAHFSIGITYKR